MKKQIMQALKLVGKFLGSVAAVCLFFYLIIFVFTRGYLSLDHGYYRILRNGLLFLLLLVIAIPMKFSKNWISDNLKRGLGFRPKISKPFLVSLGQLVFKVLLWNVALFLISRLVLETLYPLIDPLQPGNYANFESDLDLLYFTVSALVTFRLIVLHFYPQFNYEVLAISVKKSLIRGKLSIFSAITSLILLALLAFLLVSFFNYNKQSTLQWWSKTYSEQTPDAILSINKFLPDQGKTSGVLKFTTTSEENYQILKDRKSFIFNGTSLSPAIDKLEDFHYVSLEMGVEIEISGSDYLFPFNQYKVTSIYFYPTAGHYRESGYNFKVESKLSSIVLIDNGETPPLSTGPYSFYIGYSPYFKILVGTIGIAFLGLFGSVLMAKTRNQIIELAVGIFAALLAIRSYLIPENISSPILIDQLFLLYIISLMIVLFIRINKLNWENNA